MEQGGEWKALEKTMKIKSTKGNIQMGKQGNLKRGYQNTETRRTE
jgi:hypothetical protein